MRGGGDAAPQSMYWQPRRDLSLVLGFETARERNSAIMLARRFAIDCNVSNLSWREKKNKKLSHSVAPARGILFLPQRFFFGLCYAQ